MTADLFAGIKENLIDLLFPRVRCVACGEDEPLSKDGLCKSCADFLESNYSLYSKPIESAMCYTPFIYNEKDPPGKLVRRLKFDGITDCADILAIYCAKAATEAGLVFDVIVPVPISNRRIRERGFNQSELIARKMAEILEVPCETLLKKHRHTKAQFKLKKNARLTNVQNAFISSPAYNRRVLLVDDVLTTGATAMECRFTLMGAKASRVYILCATMALSADT